MGFRRFVRNGLSRFLPEVYRLPKKQLASAGLSPELMRETEIVHDLSGFPENELYQQFLGDTDKDSPKWHHYFEIYDHWFSSFRTREDLKFLEIGVARGGSLKTWRETTSFSNASGCKSRARVSDSGVMLILTYRPNRMSGWSLSR